MNKWSLFLVVPALLFCNSASAQEGDMVDGPNGPQSTMPGPGGGGPSGAGPIGWDMEWMYGSVSGMMLSYELSSNSIQVDGTFHMNVPEGDPYGCVFICLYGGAADDEALYTLNPGEQLEIDINNCAPYDGPGSYFMLMMLGRCPTPFYVDELSAMIQVDSDLSEFVLTAPGQ